MKASMKKTPMSLPWHARKAGVPAERAADLWHDAVRLATLETGHVGSPEYWASANEHFLRLLNEEKNAFYAPKLVPLLRSHNRILRLPLTAMEDMLTAVAVRWQRHEKMRKAA